MKNYTIFVGLEGGAENQMLLSETGFFTLVRLGGTISLASSGIAQESVMDR